MRLKINWILFEQVILIWAVGFANIWGSVSWLSGASWVNLTFEVGVLSAVTLNWTRLRKLALSLRCGCDTRPSNRMRSNSSEHFLSAVIQSFTNFLHFQLTNIKKTNAKISSRRCTNAAKSSGRSQAFATVSRFQRTATRVELAVVQRKSDHFPSRNALRIQLFVLSPPPCIELRPVAGSWENNIELQGALEPA